MKSEVTNLICAPLGEPSDNWMIPGGIEDSCSQCGAAIYVSPSGLLLVKQRATKLLCPKCGMSQAVNNPGPLEITLEQIQELKEHAPEVFQKLCEVLSKHKDKIRIKN